MVANSLSINPLFDPLLSWRTIPTSSHVVFAYPLSPIVDRTSTPTSCQSPRSITTITDISVQYLHLCPVDVMANKAIAIAVLARPLAIPAPLSVNEAVMASQGMQSGLGCIWIPSQVGVRAVPSDSADVVKVGEISHTPIAVQAVWLFCLTCKCAHEVRD